MALARALAVVWTGSLGIAGTVTVLASGCGKASNSGFGLEGDGPSDAATASDGAGSEPDASESPTDAGTGTSIFMTTDTGAPAVVVGDGSVTLPSNFVPTEKGGYALGPAITTGGGDAGVYENSGTANCSLVTGVVRDFKDKGDDNNTGDPDFDAFSGSTPTTGLVEATLGSNLKPVYAGNCGPGTGFLAAGCPWGQMLTTQANFDEWYSYASGVNEPFLVYLEFVPNGGVYTFDSESYFPLDAAGWGNNADDENGTLRNFGFTTEVHLAFAYKGGETFTFVGDDDLWAFIDKKLAVDLGGTHSAATGSVQLDSLGLTKGTTYPLDIFQAERHPNASHFRIDTNLSFTSCGTIPPDMPPK
ncbi:MAG TPA: fibro-slime domain-containing protein [Polyangiaceae bacterium]|nr:fibro-slime domain-containing protein [Polyangiaceae bacterium]